MRLLDRRRLLAGLAAGPLLLAAPRPGAQALPNGPSLAAAAARGGRYFGAAARIDQIRAERALRRTVLRDCAWITPEFHMNWDYVAPRSGAWNFRDADGLVAFAGEAGLKVRGHSLIWDQSTPAWAAAEMVERRDWETVARHFRRVMGRWGERVQAWDVVNEPIARDGRGLLPSMFLEAYGPDYVRRAFDEARALQPQARLAVNDYGFDYHNPVEEARRGSFLRLLEDLKAKGAPVDEVGIQAHLDLGKGPLRRRIVAPFLREIGQMGYRIVISELDVRERDFTLPLVERDRRVADEVRAYLEIALAEPAVEGVVTWGLSDRHSWLQDEEAAALGGVNRGLPYDHGLRPKPMYWALRDTLAAA